MGRSEGFFELGAGNRMVGGCLRDGPSGMSPDLLGEFGFEGFDLGDGGWVYFVFFGELQADDVAHVDGLQEFGEAGSGGFGLKVWTGMPACSIWAWVMSMRLRFWGW